MFDTLYYVARGGRLPKVAGMVTAWAASALDIKLIVDVHGDVRLLDRVRTKRRALERLLSVMRERSGGKPLHINLHHAAAPEEAERLKEEILSQFDCAELLVTEFPPALGVHAGPGALALSFYAEE
jgi:DegV family protein with EDD domain